MAACNRSLKVKALFGAAALYITLAYYVNTAVRDPYMDEIFHIPQTRQYCTFNFQAWDGMITTLPGLYFTAIAYLSALFPLAQFLALLSPFSLPSFSSTSSLSSFSHFCSLTPLLRSTNIGLALLCLVFFYKIAKKGMADETKAINVALLMGLYPLHFFFTFLFYTDVGSTAAVLGMFLCRISKRHLATAVFSAVAIFFRQTNAVWSVFVLCEGVLDDLEELGKVSRSQRLSTPSHTGKSDAISDVVLKTKVGFRRRQKPLPEKDGKGKKDLSNYREEDVECGEKG